MVHIVPRSTPLNSPAELLGDTAEALRVAERRAYDALRIAEVMSAATTHYADPVTAAHLATLGLAALHRSASVEPVDFPHLGARRVLCEERRVIVLGSLWHATGLDARRLDPTSFSSIGSGSRCWRPARLKRPAPICTTWR